MMPLFCAILSLAVLATCAAVLAWRSMNHAPEERHLLPLQHGLMGVVSVGLVAICLWRWQQEPFWQPLSTHQDAFLLMDAIFACALLFLQMRPRLYGLSVFATPLLVLLLVWAVCPTVVKTPFQGQTGKSAWLVLHLVAVLGSLAIAAISAVCGASYLFVQRRLKDRKHLGRALNLISLATLEDALIRSATLGFALFSIGLATGVVLEINAGNGHHWLSSPKIMLAFLAWLMYGVLMNVRYASAFRGKRAAWLAIVGLLVMMAVYGIALSTPKVKTASPEAQAASQTTSEMTPSAKEGSHP